jgi:hypothetical protein
MSSQIPSADALVQYVLNFTGSSNAAEIKSCIFIFEHSLRNIELPVQRSDPYDPQYFGIADADGSIPIPADMNKPILFFKQGNQQYTQEGAGGQSNLGPWIVYDRIGDRDIITDSLIAQLYWKPVNIPQVIRGKFGEVAGRYKFLPLVAEGDVINLYYYRSWPFLYSLDSNGDTVQANGPFNSFNEGYLYGTLREYYLKRHMSEEGQYWDAKFQAALKEIQDQNSWGKWSGGHNRLTSIFQPRISRQYQLR